MAAVWIVSPQFPIPNSQPEKSRKPPRAGLLPGAVKKIKNFQKKSEKVLTLFLVCVILINVATKCGALFDSKGKERRRQLIVSDK